MALGWTGVAHAAGTAASAAADPALEARVMAIAEELRCLVCQNETIAASHAELAVDLRTQIREQLQQGRSPRQILDFMAGRYGDFVLYRPPFKALTLLLWVGPFALLLLAGLTLFRHIRRQQPGADPMSHQLAGPLYPFPVDPAVATEWAHAEQLLPEIDAEDLHAGTAQQLAPPVESVKSSRHGATV